MATIPLTKRGAEKLKEELHRLKTVERHAVIQAISEARAQGDLSENAEYEAAKDKQGFIEGRILEIEGKMAALFAAATEVGAVVAGCDATRQEGLRAYGHNLGVAFQLIDDALDYSAEQERLGKTVGDDFREGKITLPVLLAFARGDEAERAFWRRTIEDRDQSDADLTQAIALMEKHRAFADTVGRARDYGAKALAALDAFPDSAEKRALADIVEFCISRAR